MQSAFSNPDMPLLMSPESQSPGLFAVGKANFMDAMNDPKKGPILQAMLSNQLAQMGKAFNPGLMQGGGQLQPQFDMYGNLIG